MGRTTQFIYAVGLYKVGFELYQTGLSYWNIYGNEAYSLQDRIRGSYGGNNSEWAIVTGASEGIGKSYALELARQGFNVKLVSSSQEKLDKVAAEVALVNPKVTAKTVPLDLRRATPADFSALFNERERTAIVVNNAGIMKNQAFLKSDPA